MPPTLIATQTSSDMIVKEGDNVELMCNASGKPPPTIEWTRLGNALLPIGKERHYVSYILSLDLCSPYSPYILVLFANMKKVTSCPVKF